MAQHRPLTHRTLRCFPWALPLVGAALLAGGCQIERLFPDRVAAGAARLTVRNAALLLKLIDDDTSCGFSSARVLGSYVVEGETGGVGVVSWSVSDCVLDFGDPKVVNSDCNGDDRTVGGKVKVNARRSVKGVLTGDPATPVIPLTNDAAHAEFEAEVQNFSVRLSSADTSATMQQGTLTLKANIHLARSASVGVCSIDTSEITLSAVTVNDAVYTIENGDSVFDVDVPSLSIEGQLGLWQDRENFIAGTVTVWDSIVDVGADPVLDPDYDRDEFRSSYSCKDDLELPQSYECVDLTETVANGGTRLLLNDIGNLVQAAVNDTRCGFASATVLDRVQLTGTVGYDGGEALYTVQSPCAIDLPENTFLSRNCLGSEVRGGGKATVKGSMRQRGRLTGDPSQPVIPTSRDAVEILFDVSFDGWSVTGESGKTFIVTNGGATGRMNPRVAKDSATGACSIPTPVVSFANVVVKPGTSGAIVADGLSMGVTFQEGSVFSAQVGDRDGNENTLTGSVVVDVFDRSNVVVDVSGALDPAYTHANGLAAFACTPNMVLPANDDECSFDGVIAENAARLTIQTAGTLASMVNADSDCGFEDQFGVLIFPSEVVGDSGEMGSMTWDVSDCAIDHGNLSTWSTDCNGGSTFVDGDAAFLDVGRTVRGERNKAVFGLFIDSVIPRDRNAVDVNLREVQLLEFSTYALAAGSDEPAGILIIHQGTLSALVQPALGNRADEPDTYDVPTPVARLSSVRLSGTASLYAQGKTFHFDIDNAELIATNGAFLGSENTLGGSMSINGTSFQLGNLPLNPAYAPAAFDSSYACTENLAGPVR